MKLVARDIDWRAVRSASFYALGLVSLVALTILLFSFILEDIYGSWLLDQRVSTKTARGDRYVVGIIDSNVRRLYSKKRADAYIENWTEFLAGIGVEHRILEPTADEGFAGLDAVDLLVVLTPQGLTASERRVIQTAIAKGMGGVFSVSTSMTEDEGILFHGGFWKELLRPREARVHEFEETVFLPFVGGTPFGGDIMPGEGIIFDRGMKALALAQNTEQLGAPSEALTEGSRNSESPENPTGPERPPTADRPTPGVVRTGTRAFAGEEDVQEAFIQAMADADHPTPKPPPLDRVQVRWGNLEEGRWVVLGFDPTGVPAISPSRKAVSRVLVSAFQWVMGRPMYELRPWPDGKSVAVMFALDLSGDPASVRNLDTQIQKLNIPMTYFYGLSGNGLAGGNSGPTFGAEAPTPVGGQIGEVATRGLGRGAFRDTPADVQRDWLIEARDTLGRAFQKTAPVVGFMPPGEVYDRTTLDALVGTGYGYLYGQLESRVAAPASWRVERPFWKFWQRQGSIVLLPRTVEDDLGLYLITGNNNPRALADRYVEEFNHFKDLGGLFTITLHADFFQSPGAYEALRSIVDRIDAPDVWIANGRTIADWWQRRGNMYASLDAGPPHRLVLRMSNVGSETVEHSVLRVRLPHAAGRVTIKLAHWRRMDLASFELRHVPGSDTADIVTKALPRGANEILYVDWR